MDARVPPRVVRGPPANPNHGRKDAPIHLFGFITRWLRDALELLLGSSLFSVGKAEGWTANATAQRAWPRKVVSLREWGSRWDGQWPRFGRNPEFSCCPRVGTIFAEAIGRYIDLPRQAWPACYKQSRPLARGFSGQTRTLFIHRKQRGTCYVEGRIHSAAASTSAQRRRSHSASAAAIAASISAP